MDEALGHLERRQLYSTSFDGGGASSWDRGLHLWPANSHLVIRSECWPAMYLTDRDDDTSVAYLTRGLATDQARQMAETSGNS